MFYWNHVEILTELEGGARAVHQLQLDSPHELVASYYTTANTSDDCPECQKGKCVQRVMVCGSWDEDLVVHDCRGELS